MRTRRVTIVSSDTLMVPDGITLSELAAELRDALSGLADLLDAATRDDAGAFVLRPKGAMGMAGGVHEAACKSLNVARLVVGRCMNPPGPPQHPAGARIATGIRPGLRGLADAVGVLESILGAWRERVPDVLAASTLPTIRAAARAVAWHAEPQHPEAPHYIVPGDRRWGVSWPPDWSESDWARWMGVAYGWIVDGMRAIGDRVELHITHETLREFGERHDIHTRWANSERDPATDAFIPGRLHQLKTAAASRHVHGARAAAGSFFPAITPTRADELRAAHASFLRLGGSVSELPMAAAEAPDAHGGEVDSTRPALTTNQSRVLQTMARFDASRLLSAKMIADEMDATVRLSEETVRQCVGKLIASQLAERPEGDRSGARLNNAGRKLAGRIAD